MENTVLLTIGSNVLSSLASELTKMFIVKNKKSLTKQEILGVINKFNNKLDKIVINQNNIENQLNYIQIQTQNQNLMIQNQYLMKLLLIIFNEYSKSYIQNTKNGYYIEGENIFNKQVLACLNELYMLPVTKTVSNPISIYEFERRVLIGIQIKTLLDVFTNNSEEYKEMIQKAVENRYIKSIIFYAMGSGKSYSEIEVFINWKEYQNQINKGNINIRTQCGNGILKQTKKIAIALRKYLNIHKFSIKWQFRYADNVNKESLDKMLGSRKGDIIKRADKTKHNHITYQVSELNEMVYILNE